MALTTEDGTGLANAESYCSVADADTWHSDRGITLWATLLTAEKEQALRRATDYMLQAYRARWQGLRISSTQALDWPRQDVIVEGYDVDADIVPVEVRDACAELAFKAASGDLSPDITRSDYTTREKVDVIEVEYARFVPTSSVRRSIDRMLAPYLSSLMGASHMLVRA